MKHIPATRGSGPSYHFDILDFHRWVLKIEKGDVSAVTITPWYHNTTALTARSEKTVIPMRRVGCKCSLMFRMARTCHFAS